MDAAAYLFREQSFEVTETAEEPVVQKRARVIEEVVVSKDVQDCTETVRDTVRRQDVNVDQQNAERAVGLAGCELKNQYIGRCSQGSDYRCPGCTYLRVRPSGAASYSCPEPLEIVGVK